MQLAHLNGIAPTYLSSPKTCDKIWYLFLLRNRLRWSQSRNGVQVRMDSGLLSDEGKSIPLWTYALPDLAAGVHTVTVETTDIYGQAYEKKGA